MVFQPKYAILIENLQVFHIIVIVTIVCRNFGTKTNTNRLNYDIKGIFVQIPCEARIYKCIALSLMLKDGVYRSTVTT